MTGAAEGRSSSSCCRWWRCPGSGGSRRSRPSGAPTRTATPRSTAGAAGSGCPRCAPRGSSSSRGSSATSPTARPCSGCCSRPSRPSSPPLARAPYRRPRSPPSRPRSRRPPPGSPGRTTTTRTTCGRRPPASPRPPSSIPPPRAPATPLVSADSCSGWGSPRVSSCREAAPLEAPSGLAATSALRPCSLGTPPPCRGSSSASRRTATSVCSPRSRSASSTTRWALRAAAARCSIRTDTSITIISSRRTGRTIARTASPMTSLGSSIVVQPFVSGSSLKWRRGRSEKCMRAATGCFCYSWIVVRRVVMDFYVHFFLVWYPNSTEASLALGTCWLEIILSSSHNLMGWMIATAFSPTSRCTIAENLMDWILINHP